MVDYKFFTMFCARKLLIVPPLVRGYGLKYSQTGGCRVKAPSIRSLLLLMGIILSLGLAAGCSSGFRAKNAGNINGASPNPPPATEWVVPEIYLVIGQVTEFDLNTTLPPQVERGGVFGVDPKGSPLPEGMILDPDGILHLGTAQAGRVTGVIFSYTTPDLIDAAHFALD